MIRSKMQMGRYCYMCGSTQNLEYHHIFNGANKRYSEKYGLMVWLCHWCHNEPPAGVHHNAGNMLELKAAGQRKFEEEHTRREFMAIFGKNYIYSEEE